MNLVSEPAQTWYRAAPSAVAKPYHVPSLAAINRFKDIAASHRLLYFAPDWSTALFEARALLGFIHGLSAPASPTPRSWTIFGYTIALPCNAIVDFGDPANRNAENMTIQGMTGDWEGYHLRPLLGSTAISPNRTRAPTQELGEKLYVNQHLGFLAPSARNPLVTNLVLFFDELPANSVTWISRRTVLI